MKSVLIVEDDEGLSRGMSFSFNKSGYNVHIAANLKSAKELHEHITVIGWYLITISVII